MAVKNRSVKELDFSGITLYSASTRRNLVTTENIMTPGVTVVPDFEAEGFRGPLA